MFPLPPPADSPQGAMPETTLPTAELEALTLDKDNHIDTHSPNAMMVDAPEEHIVEPNGEEADDVVIINPDLMETDVLLASNCESSSLCLGHWPKLTWPPQMTL
jgi:hypothetical protein